jgi:hypothetical protein
MAYEDLAVRYGQMYPNRMPANGGNKVKHGMCFNTNVTVDFLGRIPMSGVHVFSVNRGNGWPNGWVFQFLPAWWQIFEGWVWNWAETEPHDPVIHCRLQPNIPTPEQYETMKQERAIANP